MTPSISRSHDTSNPPARSDLSFSLPLALAAIASRAGYQLDSDDLNAALGLSWMAMAVPSEPDLARWPMYARDAFAVEATRLFGITLRPLHPPEAARGLDAAAEFGQHFDASYRPLIHRALENNQPVLAWRGWVGPKLTLVEMAWGVIEGTSKMGIGLEGTVFTGSAPDHARPLFLDRPPVQLYVAETVEPMQPDRDELLEMALTHARVVLGNGLTDRFDVLTGPPGFDAWIKQLREPQESQASHADVATGHRRLAASLITAYESGLRFLQSHGRAAQSDKRATVEALIPLCQTTVSCLQESTTTAVDVENLTTRQSLERIIEPLTRARDAAMRMLSILQPSPLPRGT